MDRNRIDWLRIRLLALLEVRSFIVTFVIFPLIFICGNISYVTSQLRNVADFSTL